ncbi:hypothetical protein GOP47_0012225 [Adiantum capillus-veneris]|uniref:Uncharacterized protein n=1 Tax=Adiantum capillus-veneris TaxID=13818 RepID=A0A9D4UQS6_ADICA|nr:hypothetical protein GOP47_0012225 [Adiantum capillus-veneris]
MGLCAEAPLNVSSRLCNNGSHLSGEAEPASISFEGSKLGYSSSHPSLHDPLQQLLAKPKPLGTQPFLASASMLVAPLHNALLSFCKGRPPSTEAQVPKWIPAFATELVPKRPQLLETEQSREKGPSVNLVPMRTMEGHPKLEVEHPSVNQLWGHPLALLSYVPQDAALFFAGAIAGAAGKVITAPLDRIKISMQVHGLRESQEATRRGISFLEATMKIGKEEGIQGYWRGYFPQVIRVVPYSAVQLVTYEAYKKLFKGEDKALAVPGRLAAGACAGMTSTLMTYPLDVLRLRLAVDPSCKSMLQVASTMLREEGFASFYKGLGPSLIGIAPYVALNFCAFDLIKKALPEEVRKTPAASFVTAFLSASLATSMCYPLDTVRRQLQMKDTPFLTIGDALPGIVARDGLLGLYRGFVPNTLKLLPTSSIRLTTFDAAKRLLSASKQEFQSLLSARREQLAKSQL